VASARGGKPALLCYDGSAAAREAITRSAAILGGGPAVVLLVWELGDGATVLRTAHPAVVPMLRELLLELNAEAKAAADKTAAEGARLASAAGFGADPLAALQRGSVWQSIVQNADECDARALILGTRPRSRVRVFLAGSVSRAVARSCTRPVLAVPLGGHPTWLCGPCGEGSSHDPRLPEALERLLAQLGGERRSNGESIGGATVPGGAREHGRDSLAAKRCRPG
jgi:nucleotide-binding universal stress UspA family protein